VVNHTIVDTEATGEQCCPTWQTWHIRGMDIFEYRAAFRERIDVWTGRAMITVTPQVIRTECIDVEIKKTHSPSAPSGRADHYAIKCQQA